MELKRRQDNTCIAPKKFYTCHFEGFNYEGCCSTDACANKGCPDDESSPLTTTETYTESYSLGSTISVTTGTVTLTGIPPPAGPTVLVSPTTTSSSSTPTTSPSSTTHRITPAAGRNPTTTLSTSTSHSRTTSASQTPGYTQSPNKGISYPPDSTTHNATIIGGSIAGAVVALLAILFAFLWLRSRRKRRADKVGKALSGTNPSSPTSTGSGGDTENAFEKGPKKPVPSTTRASKRFSMISSLTSGTGPKDTSRSPISAFYSPDDVGSRTDEKGTPGKPEVAGNMQGTAHELPDTDSHGKRAELSPAPERSLINSPKSSVPSQNRSTSSSEPATPVMSSNFNGILADKDASRNGFMSFDGGAAPQR